MKIFTIFLSNGPFQKQPVTTLLQPFRKRHRGMATTQHLPFDPYKILSIPRTANSAEVKKAYYAHVFDLHPDRPIPPNCNKEEVLAKRKEQFLKVVAAYEIIQKGGFKSSSSFSSPSNRSSSNNYYSNTQTDWTSSSSSSYSNSFYYSNPNYDQYHQRSNGFYETRIFGDKNARLFFILTAIIFLSTLSQAIRLRSWSAEMRLRKERNVRNYYEEVKGKAKMRHDPLGISNWEEGMENENFPHYETETRLFEEASKIANNTDR